MQMCCFKTGAAWGSRAIVCKEEWGSPARSQQCRRHPPMGTGPSGGRLLQGTQPGRVLWEVKEGGEDRMWVQPKQHGTFSEQVTVTDVFSCFVI